MTINKEDPRWDKTTRRRAPRYRLQSPMEVTILRSGIPHKIPGRLLNFGEYGLAAVLAGEFAVGDTVAVELQLPSISGPLRMRALIRHRDAWRCGMEFTGLSAPERVTIRDWAQLLKAEKEPQQKEGAEDQAEGEAFPRDAYSSTEQKAEDRITLASESVTGPISERSLGRSGTARSFFDARFGSWMFVAVLLLILFAWFRWHWNRGWEELETTLQSQKSADSYQPREHVPAETMEKLLIHRVDPDYPAAARQGRLQGVIVLDIVVGRDGAVVEMHPLNGPEILARSAMDALRWWRFDPYRINGDPVMAETTVAVEFKP